MVVGLAACHPYLNYENNQTLPGSRVSWGPTAVTHECLQAVPTSRNS